MTPALRQLLPVVISILIIIAVAILRNYSKTLAAIFATMPINVPLSLWIIYSADSSQSSMAAYSYSLVIGIFPSVAFVVVAWLAFRAGWTLLPTLGAGYAVWGVLLGLLLVLRGGLQ